MNTYSENASETPTYVYPNPTPEAIHQTWFNPHNRKRLFEDDEGSTPGPSEAGSDSEEERLMQSPPVSKRQHLSVEPQFRGLSINPERRIHRLPRSANQWNHEPSSSNLHSKDVLRDVPMSNSYDISPHRVYVTSLDSDDDDNDDGNDNKLNHDEENKHFSLHPDYERLLRERSLRSPIPIQDNSKSLVLYRPLPSSQTNNTYTRHNPNDDDDDLVIEDITGDLNTPVEKHKGYVTHIQDQDDPSVNSTNRNNRNATCDSRNPSDPSDLTHFNNFNDVKGNTTTAEPVQDLPMMEID